jgi:threonine/homoserine/homoserine lactone efflux protein
MDVSLLARATLTAAMVVLTPGPAVLALLTIGASQGRKAGAGFVFGHLAGDVLWATLALVALVWVNVLSPLVFKLLGLFCAGYLTYLGVKALLSQAGKSTGAFNVQRPLWLGFTFGLSNPKSYPVTLSLFAAILGERLNSLTPANAPVFLLACLVGFILADLVLIWLIGLAIVRSTYQRYELWVTRLTGVLFLYFAASVLWHTIR